MSKDKEQNDRQRKLTAHIVLSMLFGALAGLLLRHLPISGEWQHAIQISKSIPTDNVTITFIKNGDHRLSREKDLRRIFNSIAKMSN